MIVDGVHKHLLVSVPSDGTVAVLDYDGGAVATLTPGVSVRKLILSADSSRLYAAVRDSDEIVEYDTRTLTETARYPLGSGISPRDLAFAAGRLWFSFQDAGYYGHFASLDLADGTVKIHEVPDGGTLTNGDPLLAASPAAPDLLAVASGPGSTWGPIYVFDVSGGQERQLARNDYYDDQISYARELLFSADGNRLVIGAAGGFRVMAASDLSTVDLVTTWRYQGIDITPGGGLLLTERPDAELPELSLYPAGSSTATRSWDVPLGSGQYAPSISDVAWEPGGGHAFFVTAEFLGPQSLWVLPAPALTTTRITATAPATATRAAALTVSGTITGALPAGTSLAVSRKDLESPAGKALPAAKTDAAGRFTLTDKPPAGGTVGYTVSYAGDGTHGPSSATVSVAVSRTTPALTQNGNGSVSAYGTTYALTAHLGTTYQNRTVEIWADPWGSDPDRLLKKGAVDSKGNLTVSLRLTRNTAVTAVFSGDSHYSPLTVKSTLSTKAAVSTSVGSSYKTAKIGSTSYYYFHKTTNPRFTTTMTAYPKRMEKVLLESYTGGAWKAWKSAMVTLDSAGHATYTLTGTHSTGVRYRVRAAYLSGTSGDNVNYTTYGSYKYFTFAA
jgi:hypothetical protein